MRFTKVFNGFFYENGEVLDKIGGRKSFILYTLIVHYRNLDDKVYITINEINRILEVDKNNTRARTKIIEMLESLRDYGLVEFGKDIFEAKGTEFVEIEFINGYEESSKNGWIPQYTKDFNYLYELGEVGYLIMWLVRSYRNKTTKSAFISVAKMAECLKTSRNAVIEAIEKLENLGYLEVTRSNKYYFNSNHNRMLKYNNNYKWRGKNGGL